ncbi:MAG: AbrB/MazE/SpoVT family DNA-binding domain-containing protein [Armatimonadota bacterium]
MAAIYVSDKGQVTLPADIRKKLGIIPKSKMEIEVRDNEVVLKPVRSIMDVKGIFRGLKMGNAEDWEKIRQKTEKAIAGEVAHEDVR